MTRHFLALLFAANFCAQSGFAQSTPNDRFSLDQAIDTGLKNSPSLQRAEAQRDEGKWKGTEGFAVFLPTIAISANHFFEKKFQLLNVELNGAPLEIPQIFPTSSATVEAKWVLFDGLQNINRYQGAQDIASAAQNNYEWTRFQTLLEIKLAYAKVVSAKKLDDVSEQNLRTLQNHLDQIGKLKGGGLATNYDVLRVESQLSEAQADALLAKDNITISQEHLGQLLGLDHPVDVIDNDLVQPNPAVVKEMSFQANSQARKDIAALEQQAAAADRVNNVSQTFWLPKLAVGGQYIKYNNLSDSTTDWNRYRSAYNAGFFLTWEIFNPQDFALAKQAHYSALQAQKTLIEANLKAPVDFAFWKKRYLYSASLYEAKKSDLLRANETVRLSQAGFKAGVRTTTDVLDAELDLFRARAGIVNAQINCIESKIKLQQATGQTIGD